MRVVLGVGPDALHSGTPVAGPAQRPHVEAAARTLAGLVGQHEAVVCFDPRGVDADGPEDTGPLSTLAMATRAAAEQGIVGSWLAQELSNAGVTRPIAVVLTHVVVSDAGDLDRVIELSSILQLADRGVLVLCAAGVPVQESGSRRRDGTTAVDGSLTAALVAVEADVDRLVLLVGPAAAGVEVGVGTGRPIADVPLNEFRRMSFANEPAARRADGTIRFVTATGRPALIGALSVVSLRLDGGGATTVLPLSTPSPSSYSWY